VGPERIDGTVPASDVAKKLFVCELAG